MQKQNQADHVTEEMGFRPETIKEQIAFPGIKTLHEKPTTEIAEALALALRSRANVLELRYKVGEFIELTLGQP